MTSNASPNRKISLPVHTDFAIGLFLIAAILAVFGQLSNHGFINFDDEDYVYSNPWVRSGLTVEGIRWAFTAQTAGNWHPLTWISHMTDVTLFGLQPGYHHLVSVCIHGVNSMMFFFALHILTKRRWPSFAVAALFALHPLHVESVAWISERKDVISASFWMLTLLSYAWYAAQPDVKRYVMVFISLAAGLMAKPMLVTLPAVLILLDIWPLNRVNYQNIRWIVAEKAPFFALSIGSAIITLIAQRGGDAIRSLDALPLYDRLANASMSYVGYIIKMLYPMKLAIYYPYQLDRIEAWKVIGSVAFLAGMTTFAFVLRRFRPYYFVGWLWYVGTLVPVIGLVQVGSQAMADRYTYIPLIGIFIMISFGISDVMPTGYRYRIAAIFSMACCFFALMCLTYQQASYWKNSKSLFSHAISVTQNNVLAHTHLGLAFSTLGLNNRAITEYRKALAISPNHPKIYNNLGVSLYRIGLVSAAISQFRTALELKPDFKQARQNLRQVLDLEKVKSGG